MSEFDRYLQRLRERAGLRLSDEAERELRQHFDEAVAAHLAAGCSRGDAELLALGELGRPEVVGAAFRRADGRPLRRLAGGPAAVLADLRPNWRQLLLATVLTALVGSGMGQLLPPSYDAYVPVTVWATHYRSDQPTAISSIIKQLQADTDLQIRSANSLGVAVAKGTAADPADATAQAQAAAQRAEATLGSIIKGAPDDGGASYLVATGSTHVGGGHPVGSAAVAGGGLGLLVGSALTLRRHRRRLQSR